jgi:hypothetical protein
MATPLLRMHIRVHTLRHTRLACPDVLVFENEWIVCDFEDEVCLHAEELHIGLNLSIHICFKRGYSAPRCLFYNSFILAPAAFQSYTERSEYK